MRFPAKRYYTVSLVDTGEKALQIFEQYGANLVVIDIGLPGVDGYSVCSKIRETSNAHIMIATARRQGKHIKRLADRRG